MGAASHTEDDNEAREEYQRDHAPEPEPQPDPKPDDPGEGESGGK